MLPAARGKTKTIKNGYFIRKRGKSAMKKLRRPKDKRKIMGVCAGMGDFFGIDPVFVRIIWVLLCLFPPISTVTAVIAYLVLGYVIPEEKDYIDV